MTITVGTDVYDTEANSDTYWTNLGNTGWTADTSANKEINLRKATDYLERNYRFRGTRSTAAQRLHFPCLEAYDDDDFQFGQTEAPTRVKEAMYIVADLYRQGTYDLEGIQTSNDRALKRQKVDVIEVEYDAGNRFGGADDLTHVVNLLRPYILSGGSNRLLRV